MEVAASAASADQASVFLHFNFQEPRKVCVFLMRVEKLMSSTHAHIHPFPAAAARVPCFYQGGGFFEGREKEKLSRHEIIFILRIVVLPDVSALNESI